MYNSTYNGYAVYRFLDDSKSVIYIGRSSKVHNRIYKQHFTNRGHLPIECYNNTCKIDIVKLDNNLECKALEEYLIEKYRPIYNKQDKSKSYNKVDYGSFEDKLSSMEKWHNYRYLKEFNNDSINYNKKNSIVAYLYCLLLFFGIVYEFILKQ